MILRVSLLAIALTVAGVSARAQVLTPDHHACVNGQGNVEPADREEAKYRISSTGNARSASIRRITPPT